MPTAPGAPPHSATDRAGLGEVGEEAVSEAHDFALGWVGSRIGGAERRPVTLLCCAIVVNDTDGEQASQVALQALLAAKQAARSVVESEGGRVIQSAGSTLLAVWGYPRAQDGLTLRAIRAATMIRRRLPIGTGARITLDAGLVMIEPRGRAGSDDAELTGAAVDRVQSLQARCAIGQVLASLAVRRLVGHAAIFSPVAAGGKHRSAELFEVEGLNTDGTAWPAPRLVGHDAARALVDQAVGTVLAGLGSRGILIEGEAGIGKSTIIAEAREVRAGTGHAQWIEIACHHETRTVPLAPLRQALSRLLLAPAGSDCQGAELLADVRERLGGAATDALEHFLTAPGTRTATAPQPRGAVVPRPMALLLETLLALAAATPTVIVVEDLQWADPATCTLVSRLADHLAQATHLGLVVSSREDLTGLAGAGGLLSRIALQRLSHEQIVDILAGRPEAATVPAATRALLAQRSEGVPLYAVELARYHAQGGARAAPAADLDGPSTLQLLFAARLDQLGELKPLVQAAAIIGRRFETAALAQLVGISASRLGSALASLVERGVVEASASSSFAAFRFTHSLLRDAAYATIPHDLRETMHGRAAEILAEGFRPGGPIAAELIAAHFDQAGDQNRAFNWWRQAADAAIAISEAGGAGAHLSAALDAAERAAPPIDVARRLETMRLLALQLCVVHGNASSEGIAAYQRCLDLVERHPEAARTVDFDVLWGLQSCYLVRGDIREALTVGERLAGRASATASCAEQLLATRINALTLLLAGRLDEAVAGCSLVIDGYRTERHAAMRFIYGSDQRALALAHRAWALTIQGRTIQADADRTAALKAVRQLSHPHTTAHVTCVLATVAETAGQREIAAAMASCGRMVADQHHFAYWSAWADLVLGAIDSQTDPQRGRQVIAKAIDDYRQTGARQALPYANLLLARAMSRCEQLEEALATLDEALAITDETGLALYRPELLRERAILLARAGGTRGGPAMIAAEYARAKALAVVQGAGLFLARLTAPPEKPAIEPVGPRPTSA
ncbi:MAG: AAA family ATPase [Hyphomicrobiaceae bacterium]